MGKEVEKEEPTTAPKYYDMTVAEIKDLQEEFQIRIQQNIQNEIKDFMSVTDIPIAGVVILQDGSVRAHLKLT